MDVFDALDQKAELHFTIDGDGTAQVRTRGGMGSLLFAWGVCSIEFLKQGKVTDREAAAQVGGMILDLAASHIGSEVAQRVTVDLTELQKQAGGADSLPDDKER